MSHETCGGSCDYFTNDRVSIRHGDCIEVMRSLPDNSVDSVVTDPPYGLEFMGKDWDAPWKGTAGSSFTDLKPNSLGGFVSLPNHSRVNNVKCQKCGRWKFSGSPCKCVKPDFPNARLLAMNEFAAWVNEWATEALRVLKPGGMLVAFGGTRTWHRLAVGIEDAGFEVRDSIAWMYGSGFPKSLNVSKAIDKRAGVEREVVGEMKFKGGTQLGVINDDNWKPKDVYETAPATDDAQKWAGWGTALKPAHEPIIVARKPLEAKTVAENVLKHGTGALNIDGSRIGTDGGTAGATLGPSNGIYGNGLNGDFSKPVAGLGRWPANVILDESQAAELDKQSGVSVGKVGMTQQATCRGLYEGGESLGDTKKNDGTTDSGGASRFFYVAKANKRERPRDGDTAHPTVKPLALMRYLCKLVTPPGGTILEPFAGSGTTVEAALLEGFNVIGIEMTEEYLPLITQRIKRYDEGMF